MDENVIHLLKILEILLLSGIKFLLAPFEAERQGFNFKEAFFITTSGGFIGVIAFTFIGEIIAYTWRKTILFFEKPLHVKEKPKKNLHG